MFSNCRSYGLLLLLLQGTAFGSPSCHRSQLLSRVSGNRLLSSFSLQRTSVTNLAGCVRSCLFQLSECTSVAYDEDIGFCETHGIRSVDNAEEIMFPSTTRLYQVANKDCKEVKQLLRGESGVYAIKPCPSCSTFQVYCDMDTNDQGWTATRYIHSTTKCFQQKMKIMIILRGTTAPTCTPVGGGLITVTWVT